MMVRTIWGAALLGGLILAVAPGCKKNAPGPSAPSLTIAPVSKPVKRMVSEYVEYTGRLDAPQSVGIKARATGYLVSMGQDKDGKEIREGSEVAKDTLLFQIDPRPYEYQLAQAKSQVSVVDRQLKLNQILLTRAQLSLKERVGSQQDVDQAEASVAETKARLESAQTAVKTYELNLEFTRVTAPIAGRIGRFFYTPGNLIVQDQTLLTTMVDITRMFAYFDMDTPTLLKINGQVTAGKIKPPVGSTQVQMALEAETDFTLTGTLDFINNVVNPATGTISVRAVYDNPKSPSGTRLLTPGMFVRTRLPIGQPHEGLLVVDRAILSDQGLKYVYVLNPADNTIRYRRVIPGALQDDGLRVIESYKPATGKEVETGLKPDDVVVVGSLPQLRAGMEVSPEPVDMPTPGAAAAQTAPGTPGGAPAPPGSPQSPKK
jgi:multidrug efflux system membrane fusion protein